MKKHNPNESQNRNPENKEETISVDGFQQVIEMLKIADPAFRESLLRRLAQRDRDLANQLRNDLSE
jgi:hypothetical protein